METIDVNGKTSILLKDEILLFVKKLAFFLESIPYSDERIKAIDKKYLIKPSRGCSYYNIKLSKLNEKDKKYLKELYINGLNDHMIAYFYYIINIKEKFINFIDFDNAH
ncbi:MAG: hypothetical protein IAE93_05975 [Ignavibacteria bacterium]|nr:hypothetical protein [Ignavibacteria bacterium]